MTLDENLHAKMIRLAESLLSGTKKGKVAWTSTDSEYKFLCTGTRSSVTIESYLDRDDDRVSTLSMLNDHGTVVDSLKGGFHVNDQGSSYTPESWNEVLDDLFYSARRVAYNVDDAIDSMLADIEEGISAPPSPQKRNVFDRSSDPWANDSGYSDEPPF
jgi:hypothetical protein